MSTVISMDRLRRSTSYSHIQNHKTFLLVLIINKL
ncbi:uncharacterized protein METZ01_LOCUS242086 [marine metagenome]|uniref:Uncharacterized protein n=1 Tax=marine metagenome TaxID=408172 RepID=A0A382HQ46_9ZZZZ